MAILEQALISNSSAATSPPYATILKLDSKVRSCAIPAKLQLKDPAARSQADEMLLLQHYTAHVSESSVGADNCFLLAPQLSRESALMYLHRGFFARAVRVSSSIIHRCKTFIDCVLLIACCLTIYRYLIRHMIPSAINLRTVF